MTSGASGFLADSASRNVRAGAGAAAVDDDASVPLGGVESSSVEDDCDVVAAGSAAGVVSVLEGTVTAVD